MSEIKHTPGPWHSDGERVWRRPPSDLYENGGEVAGDKPIATAHVGWHGDSKGYPAEANARLIASAPDLLEALQLFARYEQEMETDDHVAGMLTYAQLREAARAAIAKATGGAQ